MNLKKYAFGVDIGGTTCKIGFFETTGVLLDKWEIHTDTSDAGKGILRDVACAVLTKMTQENIDAEQVQCIGVGVPGPVTDYRVVHGCENLGWGTVDVASELEELLGFTVKVENDANMAVLGEMYKGGGCGSKNLILVTLGTGVGSGIVCGENIITGQDGAAGEIGHMVVDPEETVRCSCGKYGCLEQYVSATGIVRLARDKFGLKSILPGEELTAKQIFDRAKGIHVHAEDSGATAVDEEALAVVEYIGKILGIALANVACVINPEVIVIGGGVSKAGSILTETVQKYFIPNAFGECSRARFTLAQLGNDAGIWGCVKLLLG
ncbi:MAG: ROK family glucokinase [Agathobacter sp.]